jgi:hypothetical protein
MRSKVTRHSMRLGMNQNSCGSSNKQQQQQQHQETSAAMSLRAGILL